MRQVDATIANLNANTARLAQETTKMQQEGIKIQFEASKLKKEIFWYPLAISSGLILAIRTIVKYLI